MSDWIRRDYGGIGVTQSPPGGHLHILRERYVGKVLLCIDVSGSMATFEAGRSRLQHAIAGADRFVDDAVAAHYKVGLVLWHHGVDRVVPLTRDPAVVRTALRQATPHGGNDIVHTLRHGIQEMGGLPGDRVMAIFGDGDIGPIAPAVAVAREAAALGIRIIVRGLGEHAAAALNNIATEDTELAMVANAEGVAGGISSMITSITAHARRHGPP